MSGEVAMLSKRPRLLSFILSLGCLIFVDAAYAQNVVPTIQGSPPTTASVGQDYFFIPTASDANGDKLAFGIGGKPRWASFDKRTGRLYGRPGSRDIGQSRVISIAVSDGSLTANLPSFTITVSAQSATNATVNAAPTISGSPPTSVTAGSFYYFQPTAADPEGGALTFSMLNKPAWGTFDTVTGRLQGTPVATDAGTYANVTVRVTDGTSTSSLPAFSITVNSPVTVGAATLSWQPPTEYVDGTPLKDLAGFKIRYGTVADKLDQVVTVPNPGITSAMIESLAAGTWYFAVNAYTLANVESNLSNVVQKTIL
jgi:hypothetical protein